MGGFGESAACPRLSAHDRRSQAARRRALPLGTAHRSDRRGHAIAGARGRNMSRFWRRSRTARDAFLSRTLRDTALDEELRSHLAMATADRIARGESPDDAAFAARRELGNLGHI